MDEHNTGTQKQGEVEDTDTTKPEDSSLSPLKGDTSTEVPSSEDAPMEESVNISCISDEAGGKVLTSNSSLPKNFEDSVKDNDQNQTISAQEKIETALNESFEAAGNEKLNDDKQAEPEKSIDKCDDKQDAVKEVVTSTDQNRINILKEDISIDNSESVDTATSKSAILKAVDCQKELDSYGSDKEVDLSGENVLLIDESDDAADTNKKVLDSLQQDSKHNVGSSKLPVATASSKQPEEVDDGMNNAETVSGEAIPSKEEKLNSTEETETISEEAIPTEEKNLNSEEESKTISEGDTPTKEENLISTAETKAISGEVTPAKDSTEETQAISRGATPINDSTEETTPTKDPTEETNAISEETTPTKENDLNPTEETSTVSETPVLSITKSLSSIEESIERCIANNTVDYSSDSDASPVTPSKKNPTVVEAQKYPRNYGFKIITNKIDLSIKNIKIKEPPNPPAKKLKIKGTPKILTQPVVVDQGRDDSAEEVGNDSLLLPNVSKNVSITFRKSVEEPTEPIVAKERPSPGLKVRDVESINATIRTIKAPTCQIYPDGLKMVSDAITNSNEKTVLDKDNVNHVEEKSSDIESDVPHGSTRTAVSILRPILPKCDPIASNDPQSVKLIRDLIQLPTVPVYVPDVSGSKHFTGRLHLCHGCGDRFVLLKSLLEHQNRRSCVIKFQCFKCDSATLCFFNRCEFIRHLYNHNQNLTPTMLQYHIIVERLPSQNSGVFDVKICQECKVFLKVSLPDHMHGLDLKNKRFVDLALKCQWCSLMLPSKCAYQAHRRMHFLQPQHVCPECGDASFDLASFNTHINTVCFHTSKRSMFTCSHCRSEMFDARKLERHIRSAHIRDVFKCTYCFVACFTLKDLEKHRHQFHEEKVSEEPEDDDDTGLKYAFHLCDMCPNRLIRRVRLSQHVWDHTYGANDVTYIYECRKCKITFSSKDLLAAHAEDCSPGVPLIAGTQSYATIITNGNEVIVQPTALPPEDKSGKTDSPAVTENAVTDLVDAEDVMVVDEPEQSVAKPASPKNQPMPPPPPTTPSIPETVPVKIPETVPVKIPVTLPPKKKKKPAPKPESPPVAIEQPEEEEEEEEDDDDFEDDFPMDDESLDPEGGGMEVVLNCLECGTNLTSELGSYCTACEQKREAAAENFKTATPNPLLNPAPEKKKKKAPRSGNFSCRICNALISRTCDKDAIKRHFISKHKEIFIAALQTGLNAKKVAPKINQLSNCRADSTSKQASPSKRESSLKNSNSSFCKVSPKKKKKSRKELLDVSDTEDEDDPAVVPASPPREGKKPKEKRKKSYSPSFPSLEEGMVAAEDKSTQENDYYRTCYKCSFQSVDKEQFMAHVTTHKVNPKDLQCPACGMCFVVRPSLEKHLLILHGMKDVDDYLLAHGFPPVEKPPEEADVDMLEINQCRVCHKKFDSEALLEKHFRTHGSAFLLSKQFKRS